MKCCEAYLSSFQGVARQARCIWAWQIHVKDTGCVTRASECKDIHECELDVRALTFKEANA